MMNRPVARSSSDEGSGMAAAVEIGVRPANVRKLPLFGIQRVAGEGLNPRVELHGVDRGRKHLVLERHDPADRHAGEVQRMGEGRIEGNRRAPVLRPVPLMKSTFNGPEFSRLQSSPKPLSF